MSVKGTRDGLLFLLNEECSVDEIEARLRELLHGESAGWFDGPEVHVAVDYGSRQLTPHEQRRLLSVFLEKENFVLREWGSRTQARHSLYSHREGAASPIIHWGTVRNGQHVAAEGDVVIIGDVNPGGEVTATGDIFVFGRLAGMAHAGSEGNRRAVIAAAEFMPMLLRIADTYARPPEIDGRPLYTWMEFAYLSEEGMAVDKIQFLPNLRRQG
ncbi:MAG: septation ring formation regulator EzrA [Thermoflavifilum sp.]|nr:septation ring formation regulator EzrA [Thermoflavifilum sp.]MCL6513973.1 septation ring formation regulator EzrA [Alicyclobacillus sp.]